MKSISESLVPLVTTDITSATPTQVKPVPSNQVSFAEALARVKDKVTPTGTEKRSTYGTNRFLETGSISSSLSNLIPTHLPLPGINNKALEEGLNERALDLRVYRQMLLASNIANADTPGYKAMDIDIEAALREGKTSKTVTPHYVTPSQGAIDGNTVEMDVERVKFTQNALMYEYHVDRVRGHYKDMEELLKNTPY
ncbi:flagellar basal body protein [Undibacterium sp. TS12]|uniref:flagellar basal body rod protein FlgB n=1 Tax=Undibacterium sp. TS12 TaxID=2908202 RepID=UPI001F4CDFF2|nr:flagellar basal body protein [Undibacterium sp. TS12]MCH8618717.1 flagellar basal body protein [Undibacterium sp. TS12]